MNATFTEKLIPRKSSPNSCIQFTPSATVAGGLLVIGTKRSTTEYLVVAFATDAGRGFKFAKVTPGTDAESEAYTVFMCGTAAPKCECKGHIFKGHCKHSDAVSALLENGWL